MCEDTRTATASTDPDRSTFDRRVVTLDYETVFGADDICAHPDCEANPKRTDTAHEVLLGGDIRAMVCDLGRATFCSAACLGDFTANLPCRFHDQANGVTGVIDPIRDLEAALEH
jgi:hypothetical protein